jgi:hypothetical protein
MESVPMIRPTVTQKVRTFLDDQGIVLRPWSSLDETYGELYELLSQRQGDPAFWKPLASLLESIIDDLADPKAAQRLTAAQAELLSSWNIQKLVGELRRALPVQTERPNKGGHDGGKPAWQGLGTVVSPPVLTGFLLLGLVLGGCSAAPQPAPDSPNPAPPTTEPVPPPGIAGPSEPAPFRCDLDRSAVLEKTIEGSALSHANKELLCSCMAALDDSWDQGLTQLFETAPASTIAAALEDMLACVCPDAQVRQAPYRSTTEGNLCGLPSDDGSDTGQGTTDLPPGEPPDGAATTTPPPQPPPPRPLPPGPPPRPVPLYKGVSFPR